MYLMFCIIIKDFTFNQKKMENGERRTEDGTKKIQSSYIKAQKNKKS